MEVPRTDVPQNTQSTRKDDPMKDLIHTGMDLMQDIAKRKRIERNLCIFLDNPSEKS